MAIGLPAMWNETHRYDAADDVLMQAAVEAVEWLAWRRTRVFEGALLQARMPMSIWSWGERLTVRIHDGTVSCESECVLGVVDWGKNHENVGSFFRMFDHALEAQSGAVA